MNDSSPTAGTTTIDAGTQLQGTVESTCPVLVHGVVRGELTAPSMKVTRGGEVVGRVNVQELHSEGTLEGRMTAQEMYVSGSVRDNTVIEARSLEVNPERRTEATFVVFGDCVLNVGDEPAVRAKNEPARDAAQPSAEQPKESVAAADAAAPAADAPAKERAQLVSEIAAV